MTAQIENRTYTTDDIAERLTDMLYDLGKIPDRELTPIREEDITPEWTAAYERDRSTRSLVVTALEVRIAEQRARAANAELILEAALDARSMTPFSDEVFVHALQSAEALLDGRAVLALPEIAYVLAGGDEGVGE